MAVLESLPWFESGKPLRNWMLHETDLYDEVEQIWGAAGAPRSSGRCARCWCRGRPSTRRATSTHGSGSATTRRAGNADLGRLQAQFDEYYQVLADNGVRVNHIEAAVPALGAYGYLKNLVTLAGRGLVEHCGAIVHRMGLGSWKRGREVIWSKVLAVLQLPIYLTIHGTGIGEPGAGRWLDPKTFVFNGSERWGLAVNAVTLAPGRVVMNAGSPTVMKQLEKLGIEVIQVDSSEGHNSAIAGLHRATLELQRDQQ